MRQASIVPANRLRQWRESKGLSLAETGALCGLSPTYLSRVERGERKLAALTKVEMARRLDAKIGDLFDVEPLVDESSA